MIPAQLQIDCEQAFGEAWCRSWLHAAVVTARGFMPWTVTAWEKLNYSAAFRQILRDHNLSLLKPPLPDNRPAEGYADNLRRQATRLDRENGFIGNIAELSPERRAMFDRANDLRERAKESERKGRGPIALAAE